MDITNTTLYACIEDTLRRRADDLQEEHTQTIHTLAQLQAAIDDTSHHDSNSSRRLRGLTRHHHSLTRHAATTASILRSLLRQLRSLARTLSTLPTAAARTAAYNLMLAAPTIAPETHPGTPLSPLWLPHVLAFYSAAACWCPIARRAVPRAGIVAAPVLPARRVAPLAAARLLGERGDAANVLADVRNALPLARGVARAWAARAFVVVGAGARGEYRVVATGRGEGGRWGCGGMLRWMGKCRPRAQLVYARFVMDVVEVRGRGDREGLALSREALGVLCRAVGDEGLVDVFETVEEERLWERKERGMDWRGVEFYGVGLQEYEDEKESEGD
ncbi:hypothetical protein NpPPO83_00006124 [Neofusicoccum parvum]|uniref:Uncharacterized protein n=1 Tax=Neofusicoccum parvum TaxID=310453 RepID=A0ACB5RU99_9PEZI|nr:hypothetical protein NpPPO83_00006124 [Neofusicoccum parvum]